VHLIFDPMQLRILSQVCQRSSLLLGFTILQQEFEYTEHTIAEREFSLFTVAEECEVDEIEK